jgi:holo-[acyl-carrier protein] synthase
MPEDSERHLIQMTKKQRPVKKNQTDKQDIGVGVDIIEVRRVENLVKKNPRFLSKVFTDTEIAYCSSKFNPYQHFAARFAAKEAFFKALGRKIKWTDVGIKNLPSGKPVLEIQGGQNLPFRKAEVSISHLKDYAVAAVILSG